MGPAAAAHSAGFSSPPPYGTPAIFLLTTRRSVQPWWQTVFSRRTRDMRYELFDIDTLEYSGSIIVTESGWAYRDVTNEHMKSVTTGMPLKALLSCLGWFGLVYDAIEE
jgi:hypothetical protein